MILNLLVNIFVLCWANCRRCFTVQMHFVFEHCFSCRTCQKVQRLRWQQSIRKVPLLGNENRYVLNTSDILLFLSIECFFSMLYSLIYFYDRFICLHNEVSHVCDFTIFYLLLSVVIICRCRVLEFDYVDHLIHVSLRKWVVFFCLTSNFMLNF